MTAVQPHAEHTGPVTTLKCQAVTSASSNWTGRLVSSHTKLFIPLMTVGVMRQAGFKLSIGAYVLPLARPFSTLEAQLFLKLLTLRRWSTEATQIAPIHLSRTL